MKKKLSSVLIFVFASGDLFFLNVSILLSYTVLGIPLLQAELTNTVYLFIFSNLAWFYLLLLMNPYSVTTTSPFTSILRSNVSFIFVHLLVVTSLIFFFDKVYDVWLILLVYVLFIPAVFIWRMLFFFLLRVVIMRPLSHVNFVIVGQGGLAQEVRKNFRIHPEYGYRFLGSFNESTQGDALPLSEIEKFCLENDVEEIYCCWPDVGNLQLKRLIDFGLNSFVRIKLVTDNSTFYQKGIQLERYEALPLLNLSAIPLDDARNQVIKRIFDICFAVAVVVTILIWLVPLVALLIKLDSKGPVLFRQVRAGKSNKPFTCMKFRTMLVDDGAEFIQATKGDPRITRVGKFLRKTSLDEFPQFINVLVGDMSIVGPRPHPIKLNDDFASRIRKLMSRHYVKPGITGLAQCMGYRGETKIFLEMKNRITLDRFYVEHWSLMFDIRIIIQTIISLFKTNAY